MGLSSLVSNSGRQEVAASLVLGADLQPGLCQLRVWTACTASQRVETVSELLIKVPSELKLRPVTGSDLLHGEEEVVHSHGVRGHSTRCYPQAEFSTP